MNTRPFLLLVVVWLAIGSYLRLQQLPSQWLADDEWHALHVLQSTEGYAALFSYVGVADVSTPLMLYFRAWMDGAGLDETRMRLPSLIAGIALLALGASLAWRRYGPLAATVSTGLLSLSPLLIYYSRNSRPYALALLLAWAALLLCIRWRRSPTLLVGIAYLLCASLASWLHSSVLPFVGAPLVWIFLAQWRARSTETRRTLFLGLATLAPIAALSLWPMWQRRDVLAQRMGEDLPSLDTLIGVSHLWTGTQYAPLVALWLALAAYGAWQLAKARDEVVFFAALGTAAITLSVLIMEPAWVQKPITAARYHLAALPLLLLCVARGATDLASFAPRLAPGVIVLPLFALVGANTLELTERPNQFSEHSWYQFDYRRSNIMRTELEPLPISPFWKTLAERPAKSLTLAVAGHHFESFTINDVRWQRIHRQRVLSGQRDGLCGKPPYFGEGQRERGVHLRNAVNLASEAELRAARVDYIVFNLTIWQNYQHETLDLPRCIERIEERYGPPVWRDADVVVFELKPR